MPPHWTDAPHVWAGLFLLATIFSVDENRESNILRLELCGVSILIMTLQICILRREQAEETASLEASMEDKC